VAREHLRREAKPEQESWKALQARISETLNRRLVEEGEQVESAQEADFLADHIADDLMAIEPRVPEQHWLKDGE